MNTLKPTFSNSNICIKRIDFWGLLFNQFIKINYSDIRSVSIVDSVKSDGKPVMKGTGDFWNYFPAGLKRRPNEKIFIIERNNKMWKIGFSSEMYTDIISILKKNQIKIIGNNY